MDRPRTQVARRSLPALDRARLDACIEATARAIDVLSHRLSQLRADPSHALAHGDEACTLRQHIVARRRYLHQLETLRQRARP